MSLEISDNRSLRELSRNRLVQNQTLRSDAITDIISHRPGFLVRWGILFFSLLLLLVLFVCWLIQYPDLVPAKAKLTSLNAPKSIISKVQGKIIKLFISEGQDVKSGQILGYLESTANPDEVLQLSSQLDSGVVMLSLGAIEKAVSYFDQHYQHLGEIQTGYQEFFKARQLFNDYLVSDFYRRKKQMILTDLKTLEAVNSTVKVQQQLTEQDIKLSEESYKMNKQLADDKIISKEEFRQQQSLLLNKQQNIPQLQATVLSNITQQTDKRKELEQLDHDIAQQRTTFEQAVQTLKSVVDDWKKKYILIAPLDGQIAFSTFVQTNQEMKIGDVFCYVNPSNSNYFAQLYIPQNNFGKVKQNSTVLLRFPSYPFQEYGSVIGRLDFISHIPSDSGYLAKVILPNGLITNYQRQIQYRDGLTADAEIVTQPMRLLERFYFNIVKSVKR